MKKILGMTVLLVVLCVAINFNNPNFTSTTNLQNLTRQIALLAIFSIGEGIVILSGGIDLSVGSVIAFTGLFVAYAAQHYGMSPWVASAIVLAVCAVIGLAHGFLITKVNLQPFIATLCSMMVLRGLSRGLTSDATMGFGSGSAAFRRLGDGNWLGIPAPVVILIVLALIAHFFMRYTVYGRYLYAIGRNPDAARYSGVKVDRMQTGAYVACALLAGVAGILYAGYTNSVQPATTGNAYELYAIAAAVLGGCSMRGGEGTVLGIVIGASIMRVMYNGIILVGISTFYEFAVIGMVILIGVVADEAVKSRAARAAKVVKQPAIAGQ